MAKQQAARPRHIPQRTCVACRQVQAKRSLIRIVAHASGIRVDPTAKLPGRGAYLHGTRQCWHIGLGLAQAGKPRGWRSLLERALRTRFTDEDRRRLESFMHELVPLDSGSQTAEGANGQPGLQVRTDGPQGDVYRQDIA